MIFRNYFKGPDATPLLTSRLYDERTFYAAFLRDLRKCKTEVIIESPFITHKRMSALYPSFRMLTKRGVHVVINTKDPGEHTGRMQSEATEAIYSLQDMGIKVLLTDMHHRKLAIIDRVVLYEGSLNILSQNSSCEVMRRVHSGELAVQMMDFVGLRKYL